MVIIATKISALAARALRHRALLRRTQATSVLSCNNTPLQAAGQPLEWRGSHANPSRSLGFVCYSTKASDDSKKLPSLVISEAFEDGDDEEDGEDVGATEEDVDLAFGFDMDEAPGQDDDVTVEDESALSLDEKRKLGKRLRIGMDRKKLWMQRLAESGEFDVLAERETRLRRSPCERCCVDLNRVTRSVLPDNSVPG